MDDDSANGVGDPEVKLPGGVCKGRLVHHSAKVRVRVRPSANNTVYGFICDGTVSCNFTKGDVVALNKQYIVQCSITRISEHETTCHRESLDSCKA